MPPEAPPPSPTPSNQTFPAADPFAFEPAGGGKPAPTAPLLRGGTRGDVAVLLGCNAIVFMTSVCIMVLELVASRLIANSVGSSLYTWTSVIGVVLAGISGGNFLGGWLADRYPPQRLLGYLFGISSVCCLTIYPIHQMGTATDRPDWLSWQAWIVSVVTMNFFVPSLALGTISPVTASLALRRTQHTGMTVGNVYAWGALGSIVGTFLAGFFLINYLGTQHIIWMTSAVLAIMGLLAAAGQRTFRAVLLFGWLQMVIWIGLFAAGTGSSSDDATWTQRVLAAMHLVGRELKIRSDDPLEYNDESDYFHINVADRLERGESVKALHLDHLTHSYYNPRKPLELYYEYEQVYAALTESAARDWSRSTSVPLNALPKTDDAKPLPPWAVYDAGQHTLTVRGAMDAERRDELLALSPAAPYWDAVAQLAADTDIFGGLSDVPLDNLPPGLVIPESMSNKIRYDKSLQSLIRYEILSKSDALQLRALGPDQEFRKNVDLLFGKSRQISTLFLGGGGFVFPRWIEAKFPHEPTIHVAELDPAVKKAVQEAMSLPPDDQTHVKTFIGDARNTVDDRLRQNARLLAAGSPPVLYDFVYGDAFNDFSVPWHLTTLEFSRKIADLLNSEGVFLVNIIEIFPRAEYPPATEMAQGEVVVQGELPVAYRPQGLVSGGWLRVPSPLAPLEVALEPGGAAYRLRHRGLMSELLRDGLIETLDEALTRVDRTNVDAKDALDELQTAIHDLYAQTNERRAYPGVLPPQILPSLNNTGDWATAPAPFDNLEILAYNREQRPGAAPNTELAYVLGYRGVMSDAERDRLLALAPQDAEFGKAVAALQQRSRKQQAGRFLGSYTHTVSQIFPCVYVFASGVGRPSSDRDTFVVACSKRPLALDNLGERGGYWSGKPFASLETRGSGPPSYSGQMEAVLQLARGMTLTDDYAPVDNLLVPVFADQ